MALRLKEMTLPCVPSPPPPLWVSATYSLFLEHEFGYKHFHFERLMLFLSPVFFKFTSPSPLTYCPCEHWWFFCHPLQTPMATFIATDLCMWLAVNVPCDGLLELTVLVSLHHTWSMLLSYVVKEAFLEKWCAPTWKTPCGSEWEKNGRMSQTSFVFRITEISYPNSGCFSDKFEWLNSKIKTFHCFASDGSWNNVEGCKRRSRFCLFQFV